MHQWQRLRETYVPLGHTVHTIDPGPGLPDMVFAANGATVVGGMVLGARSVTRERAAEADAYLAWFARARLPGRDHGPAHVNEGEGDIVSAGG